jgi:hypothetical protein
MPHDIPHPIGDPDEDEELPGEDGDEEDEEDDDEEPMQLCGVVNAAARPAAVFAPQHKS